MLLSCVFGPAKRRSRPSRSGQENYRKVTVRISIYFLIEAKVFGSVVTDQRYVASDRRYVTFDRRYIASNQRYVTSDRRSVASDQRYVTSDQRYVRSDQRYIASDQRYVTSDQRYIASDQRYIASDQQYLASDQRYIASDQRYVVSHQRYVISDQRYGVSNQRYITSDQRYAASDQRYMISNQRYIVIYRQLFGVPNQILANVYRSLGRFSLDPPSVRMFLGTRTAQPAQRSLLPPDFPRQIVSRSCNHTHDTRQESTLKIISTNKTPRPSGIRFTRVTRPVT